MQLSLQNGRLDLADGENLSNLRRVEVGQTDGTHLARLIRRLHQAIARDVVARRLVDQQQVDILGTQPRERLIHRVRLLVKARPDFGFEEDFFPLQAGSLHRAPDRLFVDVGVGGVDEPIAVGKGAEDGGFRLVRGEQERADARHRHFDAIVQRCVFHENHPF